jgi:hypothetical protein
MEILDDITVTLDAIKECILCTRHPCVKRRAAYDPDMALHYEGE